MLKAACIVPEHTFLSCKAAKNIGASRPCDSPFTITCPRDTGTSCSCIDTYIETFLHLSACNSWRNSWYLYVSVRLAGGWCVRKISEICRAIFRPVEHRCANLLPSFSGCRPISILGPILRHLSQTQKFSV